MRPFANIQTLSVFIMIGMMAVPASPVSARVSSTSLYREAQQRALAGDIDGAITGFRGVIAVSPYYALGHYGLGKALLFRENTIELGIKHLRKSVQLDRRLAKGYFYLGMGLMFQRKYQQALHAFAAAYKNNNEMIEALYNMYNIYDLMDAQGKSHKYYEEYRVKKEKESREVLF